MKHTKRTTKSAWDAMILSVEWVWDRLDTALARLELLEMKLRKRVKAALKWLLEVAS